VPVSAWPTAATRVASRPRVGYRQGAPHAQPLADLTLAKALASQGELGRIWSVPTPVVYRAVNRLRTAGLVETVGAQPSDAGPMRTLVGLTPSGRRQLDRWLKTPVEHMRDVRSQLLLQLALTAARVSVQRRVGAHARGYGPSMTSCSSAGTEPGSPPTRAGTVS